MKDKIKVLFSLLPISVVPTLLLWLPFLSRSKSFWGIPLPTNGMATIAGNYDGPLYIAVAKTLYDPNQIGGFPFTLSSNYYAAHFPLYPFLIKIFAGFFGFPYSMLFITMITSVLAIYFFYLFIKDYVGKDYAIWACFVFSIFPARWLIVRSVGSPEPLFIAAIIASIYFFKKNRFLLAGIWGAVAQLTKSPGILLFIAYFLSISIPIIQKAASSKNISEVLSQAKKYWGILLIPTALFLVFWIFKIRMNDFFAYFHSGDNIHLIFPPFQIFNFSAPWVGTFWLEEIIFVYVFGILGIIRLARKGENLLAWVVGTFFTSLLFVAHRDLIRYTLPIVPFLFAAFSKEIINKDFKLVIALIAIPIYLFSMAFISQNVMPISNWAPLL